VECPCCRTLFIESRENKATIIDFKEECQLGELVWYSIYIPELLKLSTCNTVEISRILTLIQLRGLERFEVNIYT